MSERAGTGVTRIPEEKNQKICQACYNHDNKKRLRSRSVINVAEILLVLSLIRVRVSGVLQRSLHVLPSQGMTFVPGLVRYIYSEHG